jgi:hypothetical protein
MSASQEKEEGYYVCMNAIIASDIINLHDRSILFQNYR